MEIISNTLEFELNRETAVAIGKFDGIHIGHRRLLDEILAKKREGLATCVMTFEPSPAVLFGYSDGKEITTREEKRKLLELMGVDYLVEFPMTNENAALSPEAFVEDLLVKRMRTKWIVAGKDVSFGKKGAGNEELLRKMAILCGYGVTIIDKVRDDDTEVSSTYIRNLIEEGKLEKANALLGMPYTVMGKVEHGRKLGRRLGMPTVNLLLPNNKILPPNGVYYSKVIVQGERYNAISNIGSKPTVSEDGVIGIESYIYDFDREIYGEEIRVELCAFKRKEMRFDHIEQLKAQMLQDIADGRSYHET